MLELLICEAKKYKSTYIGLLALLGMISPVILLAVAFTVSKSDFLANNAYNWLEFSKRVVEMFVFLVGPLITCFVAVCSVFYEYQCKTMKNILVTPNSRTRVLAAKLLYVSFLVIALYLCVAAVNILCAFLLGFTITIKDAAAYSGLLLLAGAATTVLVPLSMLLTFLFRSFIPAMVISVAGIIPNISAYHWDKCYISPWAAPEVMVLVKAGYLKIDILYPAAAVAIFMTIFLASAIFYFNYSDQNC